MGDLSNILAAFGTAFGTIKKAADYQLDVAQANSDFVFREEDSFPVVLTVAGDAQYEERPGRITRVTQDFTHYGYVKSEDALQTTAVKMREDLTRCIGQNQTLDGVCNWIAIRGAGPAGEIFQGGFGYAPGFQFPHGCVKVETLVEYGIKNIDGG